MGAITLDTMDRRATREREDSRRFLRWAAAGSVIVHLLALALLATIRMAPPAAPPSGSRLIEVKLLAPPTLPTRLSTAPAPRVHPSLPAPPPRVVQPTYSPASAPVSPPPHVVASRPQAVSGPRPAAALRTPIRTVAALPHPSPSLNRPAGAGESSPPAGGGAPAVGGRPAAPGGGDVGLGSGSAHGDLPGAGGAASGAPPGTGSGSGPGVGPGNGSGSGLASGSGTGGGTGSGSGSGPSAASGGGGEPAGHVSRLADRKTPSVLKRVDPAYPMAAQVEGVAGTVRMRVTVSQEGTVGAVRVVSSSGDSRLDAAAVKAVKQWRYRPAVQDGIAREVDTYASVTFSLE